MPNHQLLVFLQLFDTNDWWQEVLGASMVPVIDKDFLVFYEFLSVFKTGSVYVAAYFK